MSSYIGFRFISLMVGHLDGAGDSDLRHVVIRSVAQQPAADELIVRAAVESSIGLVDRLERPAHPVGHLERSFRRVDRQVPVAWRHENLVASRRLNEQDFVNPLSVPRAEAGSVYPRRVPRISPGTCSAALGSRGWQCRYVLTNASPMLSGGMIVIS